MKVVIAPDKFKGSLSGREVARAIGRGVRRVYPDAEIIEQPLADGGDGSLSLLKDLLGLQRRRVTVTGPLRTPVEAHYLLGDGMAFIEIAEACGLVQVPEELRNPRNTTTIGVGMLIEDALARGVRQVHLFLGGSATNDGGAGMAAAVGYRFFGDKEHDFVPMGDSLEWIVRIDQKDVNPLVREVEFTAVCDVDNPLLGPEGATYTYAPQKGASPEDLPELERNMRHFASRINHWLDVAVADLPGAGAAGGLGAGIVAFLGGRLVPGIDLMMDLLGLEEQLRGADLVITGEGRIDHQTVRGKVISGVTRRARTAGVERVIALGGGSSLTESERQELGLDRVAALLEMPGVDLRRAMQETSQLLEELTVNTLRGE
ncbi:glycerate kinase [Lewinella sp. W8]|uniref:glycerate kinase n=1 Tax=Lewinella sp. W8 TaxID=2528208 RepID=UPI001067A131|nr:glycerate kinase [Lewinella sp. W8]MTB52516.1 glycerate kinase [Lewinella sp. W8]